MIKPPDHKAMFALNQVIKKGKPLADCDNDLQPILDEAFAQYLPPKVTLEKLLGVSEDEILDAINKEIEDRNELAMRRAKRLG